MLAATPTYDLQFGPHKLSELGLLGYVKSVNQNANCDKTTRGSGRGRRRTKTNHMTIEIVNPDGRFTNLLRVSRGVRLWLGYLESPLVPRGKYTIENPKWRFPKSGPPMLTISCVGSESKLVEFKESLTFEHKTHSQVIEECAKIMGMKARVTPTRERCFIQKTSQETMYDFCERIAADIGYDFYPDDEDDDWEEDGGTLVFEAPEHRRAVRVGGQQIVIGHASTYKTFGESNATLFAAELECEHKYPVTSVKTTGRTRKGDVLTSIYIDRAKQFGASGQPYAALYQRAGGESLSQRGQGTATDGQLGARDRRAADSATTKRTFTATIAPGSPLFYLNQMVEVGGLGDLSATYRIVDIQNTAGSNGYTTRIKGVIGGGAASKAQRASDANGVTVVHSEDRTTKNVSGARYQRATQGR